MAEMKRILDQEVGLQQHCPRQVGVILLQAAGCIAPLFLWVLKAVAVPELLLQRVIGFELKGGKPLEQQVGEIGFPGAGAAGNDDQGGHNCTSLRSAQPRDPLQGLVRRGKELTVIENVKVGLHNHHHYSTIEGILRLPKYHKVEKEIEEKAMELLQVFGLEKEAQYKASNLPYGKQRKLEIARALATDPCLLLLDEPAAGMNPNETKELMDTIRFVREQFHMTILLIEHDMKLVSGICEKLTVLNFGQILAQGGTAEVLKNPQVITAYLGE